MLLAVFAVLAPASAHSYDATNFSHPLNPANPVGLINPASPISVLDGKGKASPPKRSSASDYAAAAAVLVTGLGLMFGPALLRDDKNKKERGKRPNNPGPK